MKRNGFTLIEIVVALAAVAIISAVALGTRGRMQSTSWARQAAADMVAVREAGLRYYWQNNSFPCCWYQLSGYLSPRLINSPVNPYGHGYSFLGSGVQFQVSTILPDSVAGNLGLDGASRINDTLTIFGVVETGPVDITGVMYQKQLGWSD